MGHCAASPRIYPNYLQGLIALVQHFEGVRYGFAFLNFLEIEFLRFNQQPWTGRAMGKERMCRDHKEEDRNETDFLHIPSRSTKS
jgi:hypothetical protein